MLDQNRQDWSGAGGQAGDSQDRGRELEGGGASGAGDLLLRDLGAGFTAHGSFVFFLYMLHVNKK